MWKCHYLWSGRSTGEEMGYPLQDSWASVVAQLVKNLPAMWKTWVWSLGWEDPLEKGKGTHSSILAWRIHCIVPGVANSQTWLSNLHFHFSLFYQKIHLKSTKPHVVLALKTKQKFHPVCRYREQIGGCQRWGLGDMSNWWRKSKDTNIQL